MLLPLLFLLLLLLLGPVFLLLLLLRLLGALTQRLNPEGVTTTGTAHVSIFQTVLGSALMMLSAMPFPSPSPCPSACCLPHGPSNSAALHLEFASAPAAGVRAFTGSLASHLESPPRDVLKLSVPTPRILQGPKQLGSQSRDEAPSKVSRGSLDMRRRLLKKGIRRHFYAQDHLKPCPNRDGGWVCDPHTLPPHHSDTATEAGWDSKKALN